MSGLYDYKIAERLVAEQPPVDALIMAAYLRADASNQARIETAFPALAAETRARFNAAGGRLPADTGPATTYEWGVSYPTVQPDRIYVEISDDEQDARTWAAAGDGALVRRPVAPVVGSWEVVS